MWVFQDDSDEASSDKNESEQFNNSTYFLESKIMELYKKDKKISQVNSC